jgi:tetratricopeptide (TPR) repeat protein
MLGAAVALGVALWGGAADARNPHCAGGIQYVVQGLNDKNKGNMEDYRREMHKAVEQLTQCSIEDPNDFEALGYLGWAYAEVGADAALQDSAAASVEYSRRAGQAFEKSITGLKAKDPKKVDWASTNRESYWATAFNEGISAINDARAIWDPSQTPQSDADKKLKADANKKYDKAMKALSRADALKPNDAKTLRNLGTVYQFQGDNKDAEASFRKAIAAATGGKDSLSEIVLRALLMTGCSSLTDQKKFDEAIACYSDQAKTEANNPDVWLGLADAYFKRAQSKEGDARKPDFKLAGDNYAKAAALNPASPDLPFNAALSYQNAGEPKLAEPQWRAALKLKPDDPDATSALGSCLSDLGRFNEAIDVLWKGVSKDPKNKVLHRQLGAVYTKAGNNPKSTEELMVYLALQNGQPVADPAAVAKASAKPGSAQAQTLASAGSPDQINPWDVQGDKVETWFYWEKKQAYHFKGAAPYGKSDWSAPASANAAGAKK